MKPETNYQIITAPAHVNDWKGKVVRTKYDMSNGFMVIPAGTLMTISTTGPVIYLDGDECPHCGARPSISIKGDRDSKLMHFNFIKKDFIKTTPDIPITAKPEVKKYKTMEPPKLMLDWDNKTVKLKKDVKNYSVFIPAGTLINIWVSISGRTAYLKSKPCPVCGIRKKAEIKGTREEKLEYFEFINEI
ncbi:MAG: hypothetical protein ACYCUW_01800 [bacterium]